MRRRAARGGAAEGRAARGGRARLRAGVPICIRNRNVERMGRGGPPTHGGKTKTALSFFMVIYEKVKPPKSYLLLLSTYYCPSD